MRPFPPAWHGPFLSPFWGTPENAKGYVGIPLAREGRVLNDPWKTPYCQRKRKKRHEVEVHNGGLLGFVAFQDLQVSLEEGAEVEVPLNN